MSPSANTTSIVNTAIAAIPGIIGLIKGQHQAANPGAPQLTDEQVISGLLTAVGSSLSKDDDWLAAHPAAAAAPQQG